jgi:Ca2+-binding RTX toxin-like protein
MPDPVQSELAAAPATDAAAVPQNVIAARNGVVQIGGSGSGYDSVIVTGNGNLLKVLHSMDGRAAVTTYYTNVQFIKFVARDGGSYFDNQSAVPSEIHGGRGADVLYGGQGNDRISGHGGNDKLFGRGGNDILEGNDGQDEIHGGKGNDTLRAGTGPRDFLYGDDGNDTLEGGGGSFLYGGNGADTLIGRYGNCYLDGGSGNDFLYGQIAVNGTLEMHGRKGNDQLFIMPHLSGRWERVPGDDFIYSGPWRVT